MMMARRERDPPHHHRGEARRPQHGACCQLLLSVAVVAGMTVCVGIAFRPDDPADRSEVAYSAAAYLNYLLLVLSVCYFKLAPPGSVAQRRAGIAAWALCTSLVLLVTWKEAKRQPMPHAMFLWVLAAASLGPRLRRFYVNHVLRGQ